MIFKGSLNTFKLSNLLVIHCNLSISLINFKFEIRCVRQVDKDSDGWPEECDGEDDHEDHKAFLAIVDFLESDF